MKSVLIKSLIYNSILLKEVSTMFFSFCAIFSTTLFQYTHTYNKYTLKHSLFIKIIPLYNTKITDIITRIDKTLSILSKFTQLSPIIIPNPFIPSPIDFSS